ncbi:MAG: efflux RND transporter periplasmic adaptor subunit, partial [Deltaproteobacteria bacterium]|nr:efflux RND transporter periplasmic adaptor subunit [Deltaproteobacteria bacterium]
MKYKRQYLFLQGLLIAGLLATGCGRDAADSRLSEDPAVPVTTASVTVQDVTHVITQAGTLRGNEEVVVKSEIRGMVAEILFEEGAPVQAGAGLVRLDDAKARAEVLNLQAQLQQHRLELENIRKTLTRKKHLLKGAVLSEQEFDDLITRRQVEEALIAQIQAGLALADEHVKDTRIRAPFDGMASARRVAVGDFVDVGTPLVSVVQVSPVKVELRIFEKYKTSIKSDMDISVTVAA